MTIQDNTSASGGARSERLPLQIPSGNLHVYFVQPEMTDKKGTKRTVIYYEQKGSKFKFMAKADGIRADLIALGKRTDLADVNEEFTWAKGGALTISVTPKA